MCAVTDNCQLKQKLLEYAKHCIERAQDILDMWRKAPPLHHPQQPLPVHHPQQPLPPHHPQQAPPPHHPQQASPPHHPQQAPTNPQHSILYSSSLSSGPSLGASFPLASPTRSQLSPVEQAKDRNRQLMALYQEKLQCSLHRGTPGTQRMVLTPHTTHITSHHIPHFMSHSTTHTFHHTSCHTVLLYVCRRCPH